MVPVGRRTLVRTFTKSELVRTMSFVAIPGLVGPMLGPIAGGLIVGYFHWRVIFFVNRRSWDCSSFSSRPSASARRCGCVIQAFCCGSFTSLQYTSMNTLAYADVTDKQASSASTIASTTQQMSISFGVASASLATAFFIPGGFHSSAPGMIHGIHHAFLVLGGLTILSAAISAN